MTCYLEPVGLLSGPVAALAVAVGDAMPLAGGPLAFTRLHRIERVVGGAHAVPLSVTEARRAAASDAALAERLDLLCAPRAPFAGLALDAMTTGTTNGKTTRKTTRKTTGTAPSPRIMGVINVTPDSFSDGGAHADIAVAIAHGEALVAAGADIIDIGGESTRPGAEPVDATTEAARILPVVAALAGGPVPVSIDTRHAAVMAAATAAGAVIVNDVTALAGDADALATVAAGTASVVLMHMAGEPRSMQAAPAYDDVVLDVFDALAARIAACEAAGIARSRLCIDPGIGFGKTLAHNLELLHRLTLLHGLGCPVLVGASRKSFIGRIDGDTPVDRRLGGSLAAALSAQARGCQILRVHDVAETRQAVDVAARIAAGQ